MTQTCLEDNSDDKTEVYASKEDKIILIDSKDARIDARDMEEDELEMDYSRNDARTPFGARM